MTYTFEQLTAVLTRVNTLQEKLREHEDADTETAEAIERLGLDHARVMEMIRALHLAVRIKKLAGTFLLLLGLVAVLVAPGIIVSLDSLLIDMGLAGRESSFSSILLLSLGVAIATGLFLLRKKEQTVYGVLEIVVSAMLMRWALTTATGHSITTGFLGAIYVLVRGLTNVADGRASFIQWSKQQDEKLRKELDRVIAVKDECIAKHEGMLVRLKYQRAIAYEIFEANWLEAKPFSGEPIYHEVVEMMLELAKKMKDSDSKMELLISEISAQVLTN